MNDSADTGERHPGVQRDVANEMNEGFVAKRAKNAERLAPENEGGSDRDETQHEGPLVTAPVPVISGLVLISPARSPGTFS